MKEPPRGGEGRLRPERMIEQHDVLKAAVLQAEAAGDRADAREAELFVEAQRAVIVRDDGVELEDAKAQFAALLQAVPNQRFAHALSAQIAAHRIAGVADVAAAPHVVRVQDVQSEHIPVLRVAGDAGEGLLAEEAVAAFGAEKVLLRKGEARLHDLVPDVRRGLRVRGRIGVDAQFHL